MHGQEPQGGEAWVVPADAGQQVRRQLFADELVIRFIVIEGGDHVIAIGVGVRIPAGFTEDGPLRIRVAGNVQPVTAPTFAIVGASQKLIDESLESVFGIGLEKRGRGFGQRGQAREIQERATEQGSWLGA